VICPSYISRKCRSWSLNPVWLPSCVQNSCSTDLPVYVYHTALAPFIHLDQVPEE
jgi:hypothetical protein